MNALIVEYANKTDKLLFNIFSWKAILSLRYLAETGTKPASNALSFFQGLADKKVPTGKTMKAFVMFVSDKNTLIVRAFVCGCTVQTPVFQKTFIYDRKC